MVDSKGLYGGCRLQLMVPVHANSPIKMTSMRQVREWGKGTNILRFAEHHIDRYYEAVTYSYKMKIK